VIKPFYPDPADNSGKLGMVDMKPVMPVSVKVGLAAMRARQELSGMSLLRQSRLSVCPVSVNEWRVICEMAGIPA
jgi:predicted RNA-binding protein with PUA-like domain